MITKYIFLLSPQPLRKHILSVLFVFWQNTSFVISVTEKVQAVFTQVPDLLLKGWISLQRPNLLSTLIKETPKHKNVNASVFKQLATLTTWLLFWFCQWPLKRQTKLHSWILKDRLRKKTEKKRSRKSSLLWEGWAVAYCPGNFHLRHHCSAWPQYSHNSLQPQRLKGLRCNNT